ncbi:Purine nucleoside permease [Fusarium oxysporum f. sp. albedinis]|nr:Purine nucleoside permease [Fusarium oxysporum f. sp. albedinis]
MCISSGTSVFIDISAFLPGSYSSRPTLYESIVATTQHARASYEFIYYTLVFLSLSAATAWLSPSGHSPSLGGLRG